MEIHKTIGGQEREGGLRSIDYYFPVFHELMEMNLRVSKYTEFQKDPELEAV